MSFTERVKAFDQPQFATVDEIMATQDAGEAEALYQLATSAGPVESIWAEINAELAEQELGLKLKRSEFRAWRIKHDVR